MLDKDIERLNELINCYHGIVVAVSHSDRFNRERTVSIYSN